MLIQDLIFQEKKVKSHKLTETFTTWILIGSSWVWAKEIIMVSRDLARSSQLWVETPKEWTKWPFWMTTLILIPLRLANQASTRRRETSLDQKLSKTKNPNPWISLWKLKGWNSFLISSVSCKGVVRTLSLCCTLALRGLFLTKCTFLRRSNAWVHAAISKYLICSLYSWWWW